jgi:hypothetical protein
VPPRRLLAITLSDTVYSYLTNVGSYTSGNAIDTGWFVGYLGIALGARRGRSAQDVEPHAEKAPALTTTAMVTAFVPTLGALIVTAIHLELGHHLDRVSVTVSLILVVLVLVRQLLLVVDIRASGRESGKRVTDRLLAAMGEAADQLPERASSWRASS